MTSETLYLYQKDFHDVSKHLLKLETALISQAVAQSFTFCSRAPGLRKESYFFPWRSCYVKAISCLVCLCSSVSLIRWMTTSWLLNISGWLFPDFPPNRCAFFSFSFFEPFIYSQLSTDSSTLALFSGRGMTKKKNQLLKDCLFSFFFSFMLKALPAPTPHFCFHWNLEGFTS